MSTSTETTPETQLGISDPDEFSHYVKTKAIIAGGPVEALCGKKWIPVKVGATVVDMPICKTCEQMFDLLKSMDI